MPSPSPRELLAAAVAGVGGMERPGQVAMAEAVAAAMESGEHLLVQAGTGTGKSLGYLAPALLAGRTVVVATATLALQAQLVRRDLPRLIDAAEPLLGRRARFAILKGRNNYACRHRVGGAATGGAVPDDGEALFDATPASALGREVIRARAWAEETGTGDRDDLLPGVGDRAWAQVSVGSRECLGAERCPEGAACFAERAREQAAAADIVVTNHALLAIDALENVAVLPDHALVVVDEAHELIDRVTAVATAELTGAIVTRAVRLAGRVGDERAADVLAGVGEGLVATLDGMAPGRLEPVPALLAAELAAVRDAARGVLVTISSSREDGPDDLLAKRLARTALEEIQRTAERLRAGGAHDVAWLGVEDRRGRVLRVAPLGVAGLLRTSLFATRTVIATSATLNLGGRFDLVARGFGLTGDPVEGESPSPTDADPGAAARRGDGSGAEIVGDPADDSGGDSEGEGENPAEVLRWRGLDVGSPFDYRRQGILYVARHLPPPGRDGLSAQALDELEALVVSAGGRTLGLFSSRRAAEQAATEMRARLAGAVLCQGDDTLAALVERFVGDPATSLFGTLSLWQGVDVPGPSCQLVVVDRIPFPRPDEPLSAARARAVDAAGGNGFMAVSAAHAAVRLAQGAGRLIRTGADRGVVAVLDSRLATARYSGFLRASLPDFWYTKDRAAAHGALRRLDTAARTAPALTPAAAR